MILAWMPAFLLNACQEHGSEERLRAASQIVGAEYKIEPDWMNIAFESRDENTLVAVRKRGQPQKLELQEPAYCQFRLTVDAGTREATTTTADLSKLTRIEVAPTMSGLLRIVSLTGEGAEIVTTQSRYGTDRSNRLRLNNLQAGLVPDFVNRVAAFMERNCGIKITE